VAVAEETVASFNRHGHRCSIRCRPHARADAGRFGSTWHTSTETHDEAPTLHYVRTLLPYLSPRALLILDDIRLYDGMRRVWQELSSMPGVSTAVDTGRFGLLVWEGGATVPRHYNLARYTGIWRTQQRRAGCRTDTMSTDSLSFVSVPEWTVWGTLQMRTEKIGDKASDQACLAPPRL